MRRLILAGLLTLTSSAEAATDSQEKFVNDVLVAMSKTGDQAQLGTLGSLRRHFLISMREGRFNSQVLKFASDAYIFASTTGNAQLANDLATALIDYDPHVFLALEKEKEQERSNRSPRAAGTVIEVLRGSREGSGARGKSES